MKPWQHVVLGAVIGAAATFGGVYLYAKPIITFIEHSPYISAASQAKLDIAVLRRLRAGDVTSATEIMEGRLSLDDATLSRYDAAIPQKARDYLVLSGREAIREYRTQYPQGVPPNKSLERSRDP